MKKRFAIIFPLIFLSLFFSPTNASAYSLSYDQSVWVNGNQVAAFKVAAKDGRLRVESDWGQMPTIMLRNETGYYNYDPAKNKAVRIPRAMQRPNLADALPQYEEFLKRNHAEKVGTESVRGYETNVYKFMDPESGAETKVWLWIVRPLPIKIEQIGNHGLTIIELNNFQLDAPIPDSIFQLPQGAEITMLGLEKPKEEES
ncbi:MAG: hypothetical protein HYZ83_05635 [Candidatus Omnitrophica bacterium]|nr:hypothetical protein [Candidatus Omnitrophota bacterium]